MDLVIENITNEKLYLEYMIRSCDIVRGGREDENIDVIEVSSVQSTNRSMY